MRERRVRERKGRGSSERGEREGGKRWFYSREMRECSYRLSFWRKRRRKRRRRVLSNSVCKLLACVSV